MPSTVGGRVEPFLSSAPAGWGGANASDNFTFLWYSFPPLPSRATAEAGIEAFLESGEAAFLRAVYDWTFDPNGGGATAPDDPRYSGQPLPGSLDPSQDDGPLTTEYIAEGLNLVMLAQMFAGPSEVCALLLTFPGQTHLMQPPSSLSDQYRTCEAATAANKNTLDVLKAIVAGSAGSGVYWYLTHEQSVVVTKPTSPPPVNPPDEDPPPITFVPVLNYSKTVDPVVDSILARKPSLTRTQAKTITKHCLWRAARAGYNASEACRRMPIFVTGHDANEAALHDVHAISAVNPAWVVLNYENATVKKTAQGRREWYNAGQYNCVRPAYLPNPPDGTDMPCHEFPFYATQQGGPYALPLPALGKIESAHNTLQGSRFGGFVGSQCRLNTATGTTPTGNGKDGDAFLSVPIPEETGVPLADQVPTVGICGEHFTEGPTLPVGITE